jgi:geranylgeranyl transferase type-1 subunit beta
MSESTVLDVQRHVAYHRRCLNLLPSLFTGNDLNRLSLGFFSLNALDILDQLETTTSLQDREDWVDWIYSCQVDSGGFRGSPATKTAETSVYDAAHLPATYFAIASLLILGDDLTRVNRRGALDGLKRLQRKDGSFSPVLIGEDRFGEVDMRHVFCASAVRAMLSPTPGEDVNVAATVKYIEQCKVRHYINLR